MRAIVRSFARLTNIGRDGEECCALEIPRKIVEFVVGEKGGEKGGCDLSSVQQSGDRGRRETGGGTRTHWDTYQGEGRQEGVHDAGYQDKPHLLGEQKVVL